MPELVKTRGSIAMTSSVSGLGGNWEMFRPGYCALRDFLERPDASMRLQGVRFCRRMRFERAIGSVPDHGQQQQQAVPADRYGLTRY